jgi:hypothetical protein
MREYTYLTLSVFSSFGIIIEGLPNQLVHVRQARYIPMLLATTCRSDAATSRDAKLVHTVEVGAVAINSNQCICCGIDASMQHQEVGSSPTHLECVGVWGHNVRNDGVSQGAPGQAF